MVAFLVFFRIISGHRADDSGKAALDEWVFVVIAGSLGLLLALLVNVVRKPASVEFNGSHGAESGIAPIASATIEVKLL